MARIIRPKDYIVRQRKKAVMHTVLWALLMALVFVTGLILNNGSRVSYFTIAAAVITLPIAQNLVTAIAYTNRNKCCKEYDLRIERLSDTAAVFMNNVAITNRGNIAINYIIAAGSCIYILADYSVLNQELFSDMQALWRKKGVDCPISISDTPQWDEQLDMLETLDYCDVDEFCISAVEHLLM